MKTHLKISLIVITFLFLTGIAAGLYFYNLKSANLAKVKPDFIVSASDLQKSFESDEKAASAKYINKIIEIRGKISSVKKGENNTVNVTLETGNALSSVIGTFPGVTDSSVFKPGEEIVFRGQCSGFLMDVLLNNCAVVISK
jgi:hypothetical protein